MKNLILVAAMISVLSPVQDAHAWGRFGPTGRPVIVRRPPVIVHRAYVGHGGGCIGCGVGAAAVAGLVGGVIIGTAIAGSPPPPPPTTTIIEQAPPQTVYVQQPAALPVGTQVAGLPGGCSSMNVNGASYYQCGGVWYQPFFGANGVYYTVVPTP